MTRLTVGAKQMMNLLSESEEGMAFMSNLITPNLSVPVSSRRTIVFLVCATTSYTFNSELKGKEVTFSEQERPKSKSKACRKREKIPVYHRRRRRRIFIDFREFPLHGNRIASSSSTSFVSFHGETGGQRDSSSERTFRKRRFSFFLCTINYASE